jgi:predicted nicotinamide N-methyase
MPGYLTKQEDIPVAGVANLLIRSLLDRQQFTDPDGAAARVGISSAAWPLFGLLWPSGTFLAARLAARPVRAGERILEIGCGLALASLVGHRRGADVTASDCHPLAADFLQENLRLNGLAPMKYRHGRWGSASDWAGGAHWQAQAPAQCVVAGRYELIIGSDLLYERDERGELAAFIDCHAMPAAEVWIIDPNRGNRARFQRNMERQGFALNEVRLRQAAGAGIAAYQGRCLVYRRDCRP